MQERVFDSCVEEPEPSNNPVVDETFIIADSIDLQVDSGEIEELVEEHSKKFSTEELQQALAEPQRMAAEFSEEEGEYYQSVQQSSFEIKAILKKWTEL